MNERIKGLMAEANLFCRTDGTVSSYGEKYAGQDDIRQFVELIVKECIDCSTWVGTVNKNSVEPIHTAVAINERIKKQFGVEE